jgi:hypothetical protein
MTNRSLFAFLVAILAIGGCSQGEAHESPTPAVSSGRVVDSILPLDEALRRFRADLPEVSTLAGGGDSRDELVRQFLAAVESRDTAAIRAMVVSRAEYAWLYYPTSIVSREPFDQMPQVNWFLGHEDSQKGIARVLDRFGGSTLAASGYDCPEAPAMDGRLRFWHQCTVSIRHAGTPRRLRLFGSIAELDGHFKFYSYANDL